jgi:hypothetical protein
MCAGVVIVSIAANDDILVRAREIPPLQKSFELRTEVKAMTIESLKYMTRRTVLMAVAGAAPLLALGSAEGAQMPPSAVSYQASPKDGKKCSDCKLFVAPRACKTVSGEISPDGWCKLYIKKA